MACITGPLYCPFSGIIAEQPENFPLHRKYHVSCPCTEFPAPVNRNNPYRFSSDIPFFMPRHLLPATGFRHTDRTCFTPLRQCDFTSASRNEKPPSRGVFPETAYHFPDTGPDNRASHDSICPDSMRPSSVFRHLADRPSVPDNRCHSDNFIEGFPFSSPNMTDMIS